MQIKTDKQRFAYGLNAERLVALKRIAMPVVAGLDGVRLRIPLGADKLEFRKKETNAPLIMQLEQHELARTQLLANIAWLDALEISGLGTNEVRYPEALRTTTSHSDLTLGQLQTLRTQTEVWARLLSDLKHMDQRIGLLQEEIALKEPFVEELIVPRVDMLRLKRELAEREMEKRELSIKAGIIESRFDEIKAELVEAMKVEYLSLEEKVEKLKKGAVEATGNGKVVSSIFFPEPNDGGELLSIMSKKPDHDQIFLWLNLTQLISTYDMDVRSSIHGSLVAMDESLFLVLSGTTHSSITNNGAARNVEIHIQCGSAVRKQMPYSAGTIPVLVDHKTTDQKPQDEGQNGLVGRAVSSPCQLQDEVGLTNAYPTIAGEWDWLIIDRVEVYEGKTETTLFLTREDAASPEQKMVGLGGLIEAQVSKRLKEIKEVFQIPTGRI
ncbi:hypothetical protein [Polycladidibacter hongkongensis]|uniref:hypothetical protein n=1 Tax=Polycladidibacter hongkongensis TaxID=1647556 RepID=UPI0012E3BC93|nr:hypothetical protein [Pseudovibrio hongkongensis]